ncbi:hypothetical protein, partial [Klebsiella aerogenes]|uniref:hypothetical protein n=1 Tax=Klebsiella aerogenes TaxID=548 RepID=UPI001953C2F0
LSQSGIALAMGPGELERAGWEEWRARLKAIHPGWSLSVAHICRTLEKHCMSITGITQFTLE